MKGLFSIISFALINIMGLVQFNIPTLQEKQADRLMIVAHPMMRFCGAVMNCGGRTMSWYV